MSTSYPERSCQKEEGFITTGGIDGEVWGEIVHSVLETKAKPFRFLRPKQTKRWKF